MFVCGSMLQCHGELPVTAVDGSSGDAPEPPSESENLEFFPLPSGGTHRWDILCNDSVS